MTTPSVRLATRRFFLLFLLPVLLIPSWSAHQSLHAAPRQPKKDKDDYALIFGTVWGPDNRPVYGVKVKIRRAKDKAKRVRWEVYSNHSGEFAQRVPAGERDYVLWADPKDLKTSDGRHLHLANEVTIHVYYDERVDTGLHLTQ